MSMQALPRLAVQLRSAFPEAQMKIYARGGRPFEGLQITFPNQPNWSVDVALAAGPDAFCVVHSAVFLNFDCLRSISDADFHRLLAAENAGLRGASLIAEPNHVIRLAASFYAQKGRTRDEAENLAIDVLSLLRLARLLEDRITRSTTTHGFALELYNSTYGTKSARPRYFNYARSLFRGSTERVFGQVLTMLTSDYNYRAHRDGALSASLSSASTPLILRLTIPEEAPMIVCSSELFEAGSAPRAQTLAEKLNAPAYLGHFETQGTAVSFVSWKHLTNDLRFYSFDQLIAAVYHAETRLQLEASATPTLLRQAA